LRHDTDLGQQRILPDVADIEAVDQHPSRSHVVEAGDQVDQRRLARPGCPQNGDRLTRLGRQIDTFQDRLVAAPLY
jgi:hypothetical protein